MKKNLLPGLAVVTAAAFITGCSVMKDLEYKVTPNPVEMCGDTITLNITGKFVEKGLHKKAIVELTPYITGTNGATADFKKETFMGEKAAGNGQVVPKAGKSFSYTSKVAYKADFEVSEIKVKYNLKKGKKEKKVGDSPKIADGVVVTSLLVNIDPKAIAAKDNFVRTTSQSTSVRINYLKNDSKVLPKESTDADYKAFVNWVTAAIKNDRIAMKNIVASSYASVEGELDLNANLANERAESGIQAIMKEMGKLKYEKGADKGFYSANPKGEDWDGFKSEMEKSTMVDKDIVLRVLTMTSDLQAREKEIKNMAKTYTQIEKEVLPKLRRTDLVLNFDLTGHTDEELVALSKSTPDSLTVEELLFTAGQLTTDLNEKLRIYKEAARIYGDDWRTHNNVGYVHMLQNNVKEAADAFNAAAEKGSSETIVKNNLGAVAMINGDWTKANELLKEAEGAGDEVNYNKGIWYIKVCKYSEAVSSMSSFKTFNTGLAKFLSGDAGGATSDLDASEEKESAKSYYLKAIMGARANNAADLVSNLKQAISKDGALKEKAKKDREFIKFFDNAEFKTAVQ
ncbi:MAG: tetratricopeptide repeat protein [Flavobacteriales bacterium]